VRRKTYAGSALYLLAWLAPASLASAHLLPTLNSPPFPFQLLLPTAHSVASPPSFVQIHLYKNIVVRKSETLNERVPLLHRPTWRRPRRQRIKRPSRLPCSCSWNGRKWENVLSTELLLLIALSNKGRVGNNNYSYRLSSKMDRS
jgi:hypothetical protein